MTPDLVLRVCLTLLLLGALYVLVKLRKAHHHHTELLEEMQALQWKVRAEFYDQVYARQQKTLEYLDSLKKPTNSTSRMN